MSKNDPNKEILNVRKGNFQTKRITVKKLENILYKSLKVLDQGFVRVIDYMGDDSSIVQAARVSYGKGTKKINQDRSLINYLLSHRHSTPFEMNEIKLHVKLPMFVARQWIRHRTANVNEYSARYSILDKEFYLPELEDIKPQSISNNQGREGDLNISEKKKYLEILRENSKQNFQNYNKLLNIDENGGLIQEDKKGVARELARVTLPLNTYTQWYWKIDLHNLMHFLSLRFDEHAQFEIREYSKVILDIVKKWVPLTYEAFLQHRVNGISISQAGVDFLRKKLLRKKADESKISKRELQFLKDRFGI